MKIKGFLAFATGTVASMLCMPVVAEETGGIDIAALLANINVGALLASAPDLIAAAIQSAGVILQALAQLVSSVLTNGFDLDAIFAEIVTVVGEAAVNLVAIVGATAANVLFFGWFASCIERLRYWFSHDLEFNGYFFFSRYVRQGPCRWSDKWYMRRYLLYV